MIGKMHEEIFWSQDNILHIDMHLGFTVVNICQNSANVHLIFMYVIVCKVWNKRRKSVKKLEVS